MTVRTRFAPSPTGFLHIGGVRTALYNWLIARQAGGQFLLRIEDTDTERSQEHFTTDILESMKWLGLTWDEEPVRQSARLPYYSQKAKDLVAQGLAYYCTCSEADVEAMRELAMKEGKRPQYDRRCRGTKAEPQGRPWVIRASVPLEGAVEWDDLVRGSMRIDNSEVDDFVLVRSNGAPTYNLSVVVDDVESRVTHIVRGEEHTTNTPKQIHLYRFFKFPEPKFGHLPVILAQDKKKLSKRHGAVAVSQYRADGYLPEAMLNFLARLGWSHGDQEVFTLDELKQFFSFEHVQKSGAVFNTEKFLWVCGEHIRRADPKRLLSIIESEFRTVMDGPLAGDLSALRSAMAPELVKLLLPKVRLVKELAEQLSVLWTKKPLDVDTSTLKWNKNPALKAPILAVISEALVSLREAKGSKVGSSLMESGIDHVQIESIVKPVCEKNSLKLGDVAPVMRAYLTAGKVGVGLFDLMSLMDWAIVESRIKKALDPSSA